MLFIENIIRGLHYYKLADNCFLEVELKLIIAPKRSLHTKTVLWVILIKIICDQVILEQCYQYITVWNGVFP